MSSVKQNPKFSVITKESGLNGSFVSVITVTDTAEKAIAMEIIINGKMKNKELIAKLQSNIHRNLNKHY